TPAAFGLNPGWVPGSKRSLGKITSTASETRPVSHQATSRKSSVAPETAGELRSPYRAVHATGPRSSIVEFISGRISVRAEICSAILRLGRLAPATRATHPRSEDAPASVAPVSTSTGLQSARVEITSETGLGDRGIGLTMNHHIGRSCVRTFLALA